MSSLKTDMFLITPSEQGAGQYGENINCSRLEYEQARASPAGTENESGRTDGKMGDATFTRARKNHIVADVSSDSSEVTCPGRRVPTRAQLMTMKRDI